MTSVIFLMTLALTMPTTNLDSVCQSTKVAALPGKGRALKAEAPLVAGDLTSPRSSSRE